MCFQRSSERIEGKSRPPQSGWKIVPQSWTGCRETPVSKFVVCSWHEQPPDVVGMRPQRTTTSVRQTVALFVCLSPAGHSSRANFTELYAQLSTGSAKKMIKFWESSISGSGSRTSWRIPYQCEIEHFQYFRLDLWGNWTDLRKKFYHVLRTRTSSINSELIRTPDTDCKRSRHSYSCINCPIDLHRLHLSPVSPPDNIFALPAEVFSSCLAIVSALTVGGLLLWPAVRYKTGYQTVWEIRLSAETPSSVHWRRFLISAYSCT